MTERLSSALEEIAMKTTEAYCCEHNIPCTRRYSDEELAPYRAEIRACHSELYDTCFSCDRPLGSTRYGINNDLCGQCARSKYGRG